MWCIAIVSTDMSSNVSELLIQRFSILLAFNIKMWLISLNQQEILSGPLILIAYSIITQIGLFPNVYVHQYDPNHREVSF